MAYQFLRFPGGKAKAVTLSYDDSTKDDIRFLDTINKHNLKCTFNLVSSWIGREAHTDKEFIKENILKTGHEIANHGLHHKALDSVRVLDGIQDTLNSRLCLERDFGVIVRGMAYPCRVINRFAKPEVYRQIKSYLQDLDIVYARSVGSDNDKFELPEDWHCWVPTAHHSNPKVLEFIDKFLALDVSKLTTPNRQPRLFYLWGHSYEFERNNNWELLDEMCEKLSGKDDTWYATNIEIYDYVQAYNALVYSADGTIIYNPTLYTLWFAIDGKTYSIQSGETLHLQDN